MVTRKTQYVVLRVGILAIRVPTALVNDVVLGNNIKLPREDGRRIIVITAGLWEEPESCCSGQRIYLRPYPVVLSRIIIIILIDL